MQQALFHALGEGSLIRYAVQLLEERFLRHVADSEQRTNKEIASVRVDLGKEIAGVHKEITVQRWIVARRARSRRRQRHGATPGGAPRSGQSRRAGVLPCRPATRRPAPAAATRMP